MNTLSLHYCKSTSVGGGVLHTFERDYVLQSFHRDHARDELQDLGSDRKDTFLLETGPGCRIDPFSMQKELPKYPCAKTIKHVFKTTENVLFVC